MSVRLQLRHELGRFGPDFGPWIPKKDVAHAYGPPDPLALAQVVHPKGHVLATALYSPESEFIGRVITWGDQPPEENWLTQRMRAAILSRESIPFSKSTTGMRLINSEGDMLPGLVVDRYGDEVVVVINTAPMAARRDAIEAILEELGLRRRYVILPERAASHEGFAPAFFARATQEDGYLNYLESRLKLRTWAPPSQQKTGGYHDQRDNRQFAARLAAKFAEKSGAGLLELGCHVAGFALHAAAAGVASVGLDSSARVLELAGENAAANGIENLTLVQGDLFGPLDQAQLAGPFGCIVIDPPKVAISRRDAKTALVALEHVLSRALSKLASHGYLIVCSCSHHLGTSDLDSLTYRASVRQSRTLVRVASWGPGLDHPIALGHEAGEYLSVQVYQDR